MQNKQNTITRRIAKFSLWAGISLCCVAAIEAGQEVSNAVDLHSPQTSAQSPAIRSVSPLINPAPSTPTNSARSAQPNIAQPNVNERPSAQQSTPQQSTPSQRPKLAINSGPTTASQPQIAQMTPTQVAANTWNGASFPVEGFQAYTSPFGYRSSPYGGYTQEFHYGLDMAAPEGSYIRNWWSGKVVEVSDDSNCGTSVVVESGPWTHIYCHMQGHVETEKGKRYMIDRDGGLQIWEGQGIQAGARLGRVGMTGRTTGPHLHWGLKYDDNWVDPALVLRAMYFNQGQTASNPNAERVQ